MTMTEARVLNTRGDDDEMGACEYPTKIEIEMKQTRMRVRSGESRHR
jgi:hypothetical protein